MDPNRFDAIARSLGEARSRRGILKTLGAALVGTIAAATGALPASADRRCKYGGSNCAHDFNCCSGNCCNHVCCDAAPANATPTCQHGVCGFTCLSGTTGCGGACVAQCTGGQTLDRATCTCACPSGTTGCGGACVTDCTAGETLNTTTCVCETPFPTCSGDSCTSGTGPVPCNTGCVCVATAAGPSVCLLPGTDYCAAASACNSNADCNGGVCITAACCGGGSVCVPPSAFCPA